MLAYCVGVSRVRSCRYLHCRPERQRSRRRREGGVTTRIVFNLSARRSWCVSHVTSASSVFLCNRRDRVVSRPNKDLFRFDYRKIKRQSKKCLRKQPRTINNHHLFPPSFQGQKAVLYHEMSRPLTTMTNRFLVLSKFSIKSTANQGIIDELGLKRRKHTGIIIDYIV